MIDKSRLIAPQKWEKIGAVEPRSVEPEQLARSAEIAASRAEIAASRCDTFRSGQEFHL